MLGVTLDGVAVLFLRLGEIALVVLKEAAEVVVRVGRAPVQVDRLQVVLLGGVVVLGEARNRRTGRREGGCSRQRNGIYMAKNDVNYFAEVELCLFACLEREGPLPSG